MKAIWMGETDPLELENGKEYEIVEYSEAFDSYAVVDASGTTSLYPVEDFEITEPLSEPPKRKEVRVDWNL